MLEVNVLDVGQALSCLIDFGQGRLGIIDCGVGRHPSASVVNTLRSRLKQDPEAEISFVLLTHLDFDHFNCFFELFEDPDIRSRIRRLFCNDVEFRALIQLLRQVDLSGSGISGNVAASRGLRSLAAVGRLIEERMGEDDFHVELLAPGGSRNSSYPSELDVPGLGSEFRVLALAPSQNLRNRVRASIRKAVNEVQDVHGMLSLIGRRRVDWNSASAVLMIEYAGRRVLIGGDATRHTWEEILKRLGAKNLLASDVVVAWHHGARLGVAAGRDYDEEVWVRALREGGTGCVALSYGSGNRYGHPHDEVVRALESIGVRVLCTQIRDNKKAAPKDFGNAFSSAGLALGLLGARDVEFYHESKDACCGDIRVRIDGDGVIDSSWSASNNRQGHHESGCCGGGSKGSDCQV